MPTESKWLVIVDNRTDEVIAAYTDVVVIHHVPAESLVYTVQATYSGEAQYRALSQHFADKAKKAKEVQDLVNHAQPPTTKGMI